jgi:hypothetical protein
MGAHDDREMLEAAKEECIRLERENAELRGNLRKNASTFVSGVNALTAKRDAAITRADDAERERDALAAMIEQVAKSAREGLADCDDDCDMSAFWVLETLSTAPTVALEAVKAEAADATANLICWQFDSDVDYSGAEVIGRIRDIMHACEPHEAGPCVVCDNDPADEYRKTDTKGGDK